MYSRELAEKIKARDRRAMEQSRPLVGEDWKRADASLPTTIVAPRGMGFARNLIWIMLGLAFVFFVGAVAYFGYYFTLGGGALSASPNNIDIAVAGPPQIPGGQPSELQIVVTNRNKVTLQLAELVITYPKGTRSPVDYATELPSQRISLGAIEPGGRRQGTISAVFAGNEGDKANVKVELEYHLDGTNAIFHASSGYSLTFSSSALSVSVDGNAETISGQPVQFIITVTSNSNAPLKDVILTADYPFGFKFSSASPEQKAEKMWELGDIAPGGKRTITLTGSLSGEAADERIFHFTAGTRSDPAHKKVDTPLSVRDFRMTISQPFLGLTINVNKATGQNIIVAPGENVTVNVNWQNNLPTAITNAVIVAKLSGVRVDGTTVHSTDGFYRSADDSVIWDKTTTNGALATLAPGARGTVGFTFKLPMGEELANVKNPHLEISINAAGNRASEGGVPENLQSTARQRIALASDLQLVAQGLYYQNPFSSSGPMPPKAGTETTYAIVFTINNTTNKIKNAVVSATLPPYVRWLGKYSPPSEKVTFNQHDSTITWNVGDIEPGVGLNGTSPRQAAIAIGFTPSTSQIGQEPALLQNIVFVGVDDATGGSITRELAPVSTNLAQPSKSSPDILIGTDQGFTPGSAAVVK